MSAAHEPVPNHLILSPEQESAIRPIGGRIAVFKSDGTFFGFVEPADYVRTPKEPLFTPEEIAEAERDLESGVPGKPLAEVLADLRAKYGP